MQICRYEIWYFTNETNNSVPNIVPNICSYHLKAYILQEQVISPSDTTCDNC